MASVTRPFCGTCNRLRLTADGQWRNCLFAHGETDLRTPLREGAADDALAQLMAEGWRRNCPATASTTRCSCSLPPDVGDRRMMVTIRFFAAAREAAGRPSVEVAAGPIGGQLAGLGLGARSTRCLPFPQCCATGAGSNSTIRSGRAPQWTFCRRSPAAETRFPGPHATQVQPASCAMTR